LVQYPASQPLKCGVAPDSLQCGDSASQPLKCGVAPDSLQCGDSAPQPLKCGVAPDSLQCGDSASQLLKCGVAPDSLQCGDSASQPLKCGVAPDSLQWGDPASQPLKYGAQHSLPLSNIISGILQYGAQVGYEGPKQLLLSQNLQSATLEPHTITNKLLDDLKVGKVSRALPQFPFISSPLGLVPKNNGGYRRIHHLSHPPLTSVNDFIQDEYSSITYTAIWDVYTKIRLTGRGCVIVKEDIKDAFRNIPVAQQ
jgi:hypothetical protein